MRNDEDDITNDAKKPSVVKESNKKENEKVENQKVDNIEILQQEVPSVAVVNGESEQNNMVSESNTSVTPQSTQAASSALATENEDTQIEMITLGSNNNVFMTTKALHGQPIYSSRKLPGYLQDTLEESLSRICISNNDINKEIEFRDYYTEESLPDLTALITKDLSEPYSIYTYRYFLHNWPQLSFLAYYQEECVGAIVCKLDQHKNIWRGYIAMLAVHKNYRRYKIGTKLVQKAIRRMIEKGCDEVVLETEVTNRAALNLYENLGFVRDKRLLRYYLNGVDAWRLKLWLI